MRQRSAASAGEGEWRVPADAEDLRRLVAQAAAGDREALATLVRRFYQHLYRTALAILKSPRDAEEVAQDACLIMAQRLSELRDERAFVKWLTTVCTRLAIDRSRKLATRPAEPMDMENLRGAGVQTIPDLTARLQIEEALRILSPEQRAALLLYERDGYSYTEIARMTDSPVGTVKSRISYARQQLRDKYLAQKNKGEGPS